MGSERQSIRQSDFQVFCKQKILFVSGKVILTPTIVNFVMKISGSEFYHLGFWFSRKVKLIKTIETRGICIPTDPTDRLAWRTGYFYQ